ncbi:MAG: radical SAM protein [Desulfarculaceae bacterium]
MEPDLQRLLAQARGLSWERFGKRLDIYLPGMFIAYGRKGRYPAVSITGRRCELGCLHCQGRLLESMIPAQTGEELLALGRRLWREGQKGILLSGGSDGRGRLPWQDMLTAIATLHQETGLIMTAHVGRIDKAIARALKDAGVRQALVDIVGDEDTAREILHLDDGLKAQAQTLAACQSVGLEIVPHVILGLHYGSWRGEERALDIVAGLATGRVVYVVLMPLKNTPLATAGPLPVLEVARFLGQARLRLPQARHQLGCARPRGRYRQELDRLAVQAGINALALPSDGAVQAAQGRGVQVRNFDTCCSLSGWDSEIRGA